MKKSLIDRLLISGIILVAGISISRMGADQYYYTKQAEIYPILSPIFNDFSKSAEATGIFLGGALLSTVIAAAYYKKTK